MARQLKIVREAELDRMTNRVRQVFEARMAWKKDGSTFRVGHEVDAKRRVWYVDVLSGARWLSYAKGDVQEVYNEIVLAIARGEGPDNLNWE